MDYHFYYKLRNSAAFKFNDALEYNSKFTITSPVTLNKTNGASYSVTDASRFNAKYLPYKSQNYLYYNGGAANGDSVIASGLIANLFSDSILSSGYRMSNSIDQWTSGTRSGKVLYRAMPSSL